MPHRASPALRESAGASAPLSISFSSHIRQRGEMLPGKYAGGFALMILAANCQLNLQSAMVAGWGRFSEPNPAPFFSNSFTVAADIRCDPPNPNPPPHATDPPAGAPACHTRWPTPNGETE